jgi:2-polyprenyl-6-methoxyphenol hydroxylase-like FAD-dependent oxidoreductase
MNYPRVAIIGGGVAGMALLKGLHDRRVDARVYERALVDDRKGFGFLLLENGLRALRTLGVTRDPRDFGRSIERALICSASGDVLIDEAVVGAVAVGRAELLTAIGEGLSASQVCTGYRFSGMRWVGEEAYYAEFEDHAPVHADAFIGSDGVQSKCRRSMQVACDPRPGRVREIVSAIELPSLAKTLGSTFTKFMSPRGGLAVGLVPSIGGRVIWFVQYDSERFATPEPHQARDFFEEHLAEFPASVQAAIAATDPSTPHVWRTVDMDPPESLVRGNVALIGDAAHPVLPFTSQGANSALEDAAMLAESLAACDADADVRLAMRSYDLARRPAAQRFVDAGRELASQFVQPVSDRIALPLVTA